jgi:tetratricopeptide (TPR) repeat protein
MNENQNEQAAVHDSLCVNCKSNPCLENSPTKICGSCRALFIKYPIPKWIWGFAGGIVVIMLIGAFRMPAYVKAGLRISRAEKLIEEKRYVSAQRELEEVLERFPKNKNANGWMVVSSSYNLDMEQMNKSLDIVENEKFDDDELLSKMNAAVAYMGQSFSKDTTLGRRIYEVKDSTQALENLFTTMESTGDQDFAVAGVVISHYLFDLKEYSAIEKILKRVLEAEPNYYSALLLDAAVKRNTGDFEGAIASCNKALEINKEDVPTLSMLARIELKRKQDREAANYAKLALELSPNNISAMEAQSMVDFYAGRLTESKNLLVNIQQQESKTGDSTISTRLSSIINKTEIYR